MYRYRLLLVSLALSMCVAHQTLSQNVSLVLGSQPQAMWHLDFVNNVTVTNTSSSVLCHFQFDILKSNGAQVASIQVSSVLVATGSNPLRQLSRGKTTVKYGSDIAASHLQATETLPAGGYVFNASLFNAATGEVLATASMETPLFLLQTPLRLQYPDDGDTIYTTEPTLQWIPPQPLVPDLEYTLFVYKTKQNGKKNKEVFSAPIKKASSLNQPLFLYSAQMPALEYERTYAWKVIGTVDGYQMAESDTWTFTPFSRKNATDTTATTRTAEFEDSLNFDQPYWILNESLDAGYLDAYGVCKLTFANRGTDTLLYYSLLHLNEPNDSITGLQPIRMVQGLNYVTIPLANVQGMVDDHYYLLHIRMSDLAEYRVRFKYRQ
jgi:hypothetical protein